MEVPFPFIVLFLCVISKIMEISGEHCNSMTYREPMTVFRINNDTSRICNTNGAKTSYSVLESNFGEITINVHLNRTLTLGKYIFELHENCDTLHTRQRFEVCANECNETEHMFTPACINELMFNVTYVYGGSYCVKLMDEQQMEIWNSETFAVNTNYTATDMNEGTTILAGNCIEKPVKNQVEASIVTNKTVFLIPPVLKMILAPQSAVENFINDQNTDFICNSNYSSLCRTTGHNYTCIFNVTPGQYTMLALLSDPRCNENWTDDPHTCMYTNYNCAMINPSVAHVGPTQKIVIGSILLVTIFACVVFFVVKNWKNRTRTRNNLNARYTLQATNEGNEYLIVYARESEEFEKIVDKLKQLLINGNCSKVITLYELDRKCVDPKRWLQEKLRDDTVKIILLLNVASAYARDRNYVYKTPHCFDFLFPYALQLLQSYEQRSYHNLYKVLTPGADLEQFRFINTLTVYTIPQHTDDLLCQLNIDQRESEDFKNECNAYHYILSNEQYLSSIFYERE